MTAQPDLFAGAKNSLLDTAMAEIETLIAEAQAAESESNPKTQAGDLKHSRLQGRIQGLMAAKRIVGNLRSYGEIIE